jgi:hypothetical protein
VQTVAKIVLKLVIPGCICVFVLFVARWDVVTHQGINMRLNISIKQSIRLFNLLNQMRIGNGVMLMKYISNKVEDYRSSELLLDNLLARIIM